MAPSLRPHRGGSRHWCSVGWRRRCQWQEGAARYSGQRRVAATLDLPTCNSNPPTSTRASHHLIPSMSTGLPNPEDWVPERWAGGVCETQCALQTCVLPSGSGGIPQGQGLSVSVHSRVPQPAQLKLSAGPLSPCLHFLSPAPFSPSPLRPLQARPPLLTGLGNLVPHFPVPTSFNCLNMHPAEHVPCVQSCSKYFTNPNSFINCLPDGLRVP